jgi:hypothetical protein
MVVSCLISGRRRMNHFGAIMRQREWGDLAQTKQCTFIITCDLSRVHIIRYWWTQCVVSDDCRNAFVRNILVKTTGDKLSGGVCFFFPTLVFFPSASGTTRSNPTPYVIVVGGMDVFGGGGGKIVSRNEIIRLLYCLDVLHPWCTVMHVVFVFVWGFFFFF